MSPYSLHKAVKGALIVAVMYVGMAVQAFDKYNPKDLAVVLRGGESVNNGDDNERRYYFGDNCYIYFPSSGALSSGIDGTMGLWDTKFRPNQWDNPHSFCTTSSVRYKLQNDGNFVIRCNDADDTVDFSTHSNQGSLGDYFMAIDSSCHLHIFAGTFTCDEINIRDEIWSSDKIGPWNINDRLYKGQIYHGLYGEIVLNPEDGNLEVRDPGSHGTYELAWSAKDEWEAPPGDKFHDYYAKLTPGGRLLLVGIEYTPEGQKQEVYFEKDLDSGGADCYTLGYEVVDREYWGFNDPVDLIAVPCE